MRTWLDGVRQGQRFARLDLETQRDVLDLFARSARTVLDGWFESEAVKAAFGFDAVVGNYASPDTLGSAYVLLHHVFGEVNGRRGAWGHSVGGMGAITQIMAQVCRAAGVEISLESPVARVLVDGERAVGVRLLGGEEIAADRVVANVGPKLLYDRLIDAADLPADFRRRIRAFKVGSGTFRMNVALTGLPKFTCLPEPGEHHQSGIILAPTLDYMDRAFLDAKRYGWSKAPIVEMLIPSTVDDGLAPPGCHVASLFCQQFAPELPDGRDWDAEEGAAADAILDTVDDARSRLSRQHRRPDAARAPRGSERRFGLVGGDIMHGAMSLDQRMGGAAGARSRRLSRAGAGTLYVRCGHPPRRRRHRRAGA